MNGMKPIWPLAVALVTSAAWAGPASAGRQPNPLPVFAADGTRHDVVFSRDGLRFAGQRYLPVGKRAYEVVVTAPDCESAPGPGHEVGRLTLSTAWDVTWTWTRFRGCRADRRSLWDSETRTYSPSPPPIRCDPSETRFVRRKGKQRVTLWFRDHCDGTARLRVDGVPSSAVVSLQRPGRWGGVDRARRGDADVQWSVRALRHRPGADVLRLDARVRWVLEAGGQTQTIALKGTYRAASVR